MAIFNKFENQEVCKLNCDISGLSSDMHVGDIIAVEAKTDSYGKVYYTVAQITAVSEPESQISVEENIKTAIAAGKEIYVIAQGDMITYNEPTDYKTYIVSDVVKITGGPERTHAVENKKIIVGYLVKTPSNVEV